MKHPVLTVDIRRNGVAESIQYVHGVLVDAGGVAEVWGDAEAVIFPRSTLKPVQALPLLESGATAQFKLSPAELALACASHNGEDEHVALARGWLSRLNLKESDLECGAHWPYHKGSEHALAGAHQKPCNLHNNCSGKHLGMMTACLHLNLPIEGYVLPAHPLQQSILRTFAELAEYPLPKMTIGIDGCSAPNPALPLQHVARAFFNLMQRDSGMQLLQAMAQNPFFVAGNDRFDTKLMQAAGGALVSKIGAEGSLLIINLPEKSVLYLKAEDGQGRASYVAAGKILQDLGWLKDDNAVADYTCPVLKNWRGIETGDIVLRLT